MALLTLDCRYKWMSALQHLLIYQGDKELHALSGKKSSCHCFNFGKCLGILYSRRLQWKTPILWKRLFAEIPGQIGVDFDLFILKNGLFVCAEYSQSCETSTRVFSAFILLQLITITPAIDKIPVMCLFLLCDSWTWFSNNTEGTIFQKRRYSKNTFLQCNKQKSNASIAWFSRTFFTTFVAVLRRKT